MLTTQIENHNGIQLVHVSGALDSLAHDSFKDLLGLLVDQSNLRTVLDCTALTYINSQNLALLARYQRISLGNLSFLGIAGLNRRITKTIEVLGLGKLVKLYASVDEAMAAAAAL